jgi:HAD superfamily hydrolase (TIGR01509 family)
MNTVESVLFDLDGVLVDACDWHYDALNEALNEVVGYKISKKDHETKYNGLPTAVKLNILKIKKEDQDKIWNLKQKYTSIIINKKAKILPSKIELLNFLKNNDIIIGCVTNSIKKTATEMLQKTGQFNYIDFLITNEDVKNNKPSPECYNFAIDKFFLNADKTICVEDSPKGIEAAKNSKAKWVWQVPNFDFVTLTNYKNYVDKQ